jgi:hypothetical protein
VLGFTPTLGQSGVATIPYFTIYVYHFTKFFIPGIEVLFQSSDKILRVEALGLSSKLVYWRLWQNVEL